MSLGLLPYSELARPQVSSLGIDQAGASMVEFALAAFFVILILGGLFDAGLAMHHYSMLEHVTEDAVRHIATDLNLNGDCARVARYLDEDASNHLHQALGVHGNRRVEWRLLPADDASLTAMPRFSGTLRTLQLTGRIGLNCYLLCSVVPNFTITATSESIVETNRACRIQFPQQPVG